ncbi:MAG: hypothetical protein JO113_01620, partial [Candidatus Eremiobacteraeota bacterium]|nr:hypothetical protein [Candidatus Eremiobacteraeota bacterium]
MLAKRIAVFLVALLCACAGNGAPAAPPIPPDSIHRVSSSGKIQHIVILMQENRSFNNLFMGYRGATTQSYGYDSKGQELHLKPVPLEEPQWDIEHDSSGYFAACNGTGSIPGTNCQMNGFDKEWLTCGGPSQPACPLKHPMYAYVPHTETKPLFDIA